MKKHLKQSTACNIMAITSCTMAVLIFICGMVTALLFAGVTGLNTDHQSLSSNVRQLVSAVNFQKDMARSYSQDGNAMYLDMYNKDAGTKIHSILSDMMVLTVDPQGKKQLDNISASVEAMTSAEQQIISLVKSGRLEEARALAFGKDYGTMMDNLNTSVAEFEEGMSRGIGAIIKRQSDNVMVLGVCIEILCILLILIQIANAMVTKKFIIKPLIKLKSAMIEMCAGNLSVSIDVEADHTEMGELAGAMIDMQHRISNYIREIDFVLQQISQKDISVRTQQEYVGDFESIQISLNMIIASLSETFATLGRSIEQISSGAEHVSSAAQALAHGAAEQASSVEQLSGSIGHVSEQITSNSAYANKANSFAATAGASLEDSNKQMGTMVSAMTEISASSAEIGKIIKTIEDIAFQTNILALNAAVEAARAGAAGKGFAVVADEVRNLANKSSEAAKQTNALIEASVKSVENGVKIAGDTANSLTEVVTGSLAMADLISKISQSTTQQSTSIMHINQGVERISAVVHTNSATSQQSAAASQELSSQASIMKSMVSAYKVSTGLQYSSPSLSPSSVPIPITSASMKY